jgi:hypothetical protein
MKCEYLGTIPGLQLYLTNNKFFDDFSPGGWIIIIFCDIFTEIDILLKFDNKHIIWYVDFPASFEVFFIVDCNLQVLIYWERVVLHFPRILHIQQIIWTETKYLQHVFCCILWSIVSPDTWVYPLCINFANLKSGFKIQHDRNKISHINYKMSF